MDLQDLVLNFRKQVEDQEPPYLCDDDEALLYIIDAQDKFVRIMGGISDNGGTGAGTTLTDLAMMANTPTSSFSPFILRIRSAKLITAQRNIEIIDESQLDDMCRINDYGIVTSTFLRDTDTGSVNYGIIGLEDNKLRWYKVPSTADTCRLHIYRLPYPRIADQEDSLEIDEQHHLHLIKWMKYHFYSKDGAETYDKDLAAKNEASFVEYCEKARAEKDRQRFKPRVVRMSW